MRRPLPFEFHPGQAAVAPSHGSPRRPSPLYGAHNPLPLLLVTCALAFLAGGCQWFGRTKLPESERVHLVRELKSAVDEAGGEQLWVKMPGGFPAIKPRLPIEVLATSQAYPAVVSALEKQSQQSGLEMRMRQYRGRDGRPSAEVRIGRRGELVCRWRVREVPRLLRAAIVIDDLGEDLEAARKLLAMPYPLTFSVLPRLPHSVAVAEEAHGTGREVMLHLPMQPEPGSRLSPGEGALRAGMGREEVGEVLATDLKTVPYAVGVNNHMGSLATTEPLVMAALMEDLAKRRLYFVDSRTTAASVALAAARRRGVPAMFRSVFLDDSETFPYTLAQLSILRHVVEQQGAALAIGHPHPTTLAALAKFLPELERADIELVPPSQLVRLPEVARLEPR